MAVNWFDRRNAFHDVRGPRSMKLLGFPVTLREVASIVIDLPNPVRIS
jgi:hypothetical protein